MGAQPTLRSVNLIVSGRVRDLEIFPPFFYSLIATERGIYGCSASATNCPIIESHKNDWDMYTGLYFCGAMGKEGI